MVDPDERGPLAPKTRAPQIDAFVEAARSVPAPSSGTRGRLIFALDATMSRQATWDLAQSLQGRMFEAAAEVGGLDVQLVYFRGMDECRASSFVSGGQGLAALMSAISVRGGTTQLRKVLVHARDEAKAAQGRRAGLRRRRDGGGDRRSAAGRRANSRSPASRRSCSRKAPIPRARRAFQEIARLTGGAYGAFDAGAAARLEALLRAAAAYAAGGRTALEALARATTPHARPLARSRCAADEIG